MAPDVGERRGLGNAPVTDLFRRGEQLSQHQEWSGGFARVLASGKPSVASRRRAVQIALECVKKGRPNQLVDDDRGCEGRAATGRFRKAGFVSTIRRRYFFLPDDLTKRL